MGILVVPSVKLRRQRLVLLEHFTVELILDVVGGAGLVDKGGGGELGCRQHQHNNGQTHEVHVGSFWGLVRSIVKRRNESILIADDTIPKPIIKFKEEEIRKRGSMHLRLIHGRQPGDLHETHGFLPLSRNRFSFVVAYRTAIFFKKT